MRFNSDINLFRAILIGLVILVHIVNFGDLYPTAKSAILSFIMPAFLMITGYLVNIDKPAKDFAIYILRIWLPYMIMVLGYAVLSLRLPVRDGIEVFNLPTILQILFIKSIGPYWFLHTMIVCGVIYYVSFRLARKLELTSQYSIFASSLIIVSILTPAINTVYAVYYLMGVGIRLYIKDFSKIYKNSLWPLLPFMILISDIFIHNLGTLSILICVIAFFCFSAQLFPFISGKSKHTLEYIGRNTLPIYIFHPIFTMMSKFMLPAFKFDSSGILHAAATIIIGIIGSIAIAKFLDWSRLTYIFGRKKLLR